MPPEGEGEASAHRSGEAYKVQPLLALTANYSAFDGYLWTAELCALE